MVRSIDIADDGRVGGVVSLTTPGCPIRTHFQQAVAQNVAELEGVTRVAVDFDVLSEEERASLQQTLGRPAPPRGRAGPGQERHLRRLRQGRRRQVDDDRQPRRRARRRRAAQPARSTADVYGYSIPRMLGVKGRPEVNERAKDHPDGRARRHQGDVDRLLRRGERGRRLARADAPQGDPAVPRGRRLGRARLPAARPAARHGRRLDDAGAAPSPGEDR